MTSNYSLERSDDVGRPGRRKISGTFDTGMYVHQSERRTTTTITVMYCTVPVG
jgi:hypothetical protein